MNMYLFCIFLYFDFSNQLDILFNYEYISGNLYDKKEFIKYVLEDWVKDRINSVLQKKSEDDFEFSKQFECEGITKIKEMPQNINADLLIFVFLQDTTNFIATSKTCYYHPTSKRPIVGVIELSMVRFQIFTENSFYAANTLLHEVIHILGFSKKNFEQNPKGINSFVQSNSLSFAKIGDVARKHFNCQTIGSVHLENEGGSSSNGNHFEFMQLGNELMNPQFSTSLVLSEFTLSVLDQTGYYTVDYDKTEPLIWGLNQGCSFNGQCKQDFIEFCKDKDQIICSQDFSSKAVCEQTNFSDGCLIPNEQIGYSCRRNYDLIQTSSFEESGKYSRCFLTEKDSQKTAGCYKTQCNNDGTVVEVKIADDWYQCDSSNKNYVVQNIKVYCPDPKIFCQRTRLNECSNDCNGKGQCLKDGSCFCDYFYGGGSCTKFLDCQQGSPYLCSSLKKTFHRNTFSFIKIFIQMNRKKKIQKSSKTVDNNTTLKKLELSKRNPLNNVLYSQKYFEILKQREKLPAFQTKEVFLELLEKNDIVIIQGETGSGKTTQVPQFLLQTDYSQNGLIAVTQPRRIAAMSVAQRVSEETDTILGEIIGYSVRFDERSSSQTLIKYMTDGMLIRELMLDNKLEKFSVVMLDEAHERTLNNDILMGVLKQLVQERSNTNNPLKLVIMSATIEIERFQKYFENEAPVLQIPGRQFPVEIFYTPQPEEDYLEACIRTAIQIHLHEEKGDILIFLTGEDEIEYAVEKIALEIDHYQEEADPVVVYPLYGALSSFEQQKVFKKLPDKYRKIVVATNIAETSVTIDGIVYVIDSGLQKQKIYNPRMKYESLLVAPISKASSKQRAGRAGRTRPGKCYRLYTESSYKNELKEYSIPDVLRSELSSTILQLLILGVKNVISFDFMDPPSPETMSRSLETLVYLKAIDAETGSITKLGRILGLFPLEPRIASVLVKAKELRCDPEVLNAISVITSGNWRLRPKDKSALADMAHKKFQSEQNCDLYASNLALQKFIESQDQKNFCFENFLNFRTLQNAAKIRNQLSQILHNTKIDFVLDKYNRHTSQQTRFKICFLNGYFQQVAFFANSNVYKIFNEHHQVLIHPSTLMKTKPKWVLYIEFVLTSKNYIRTVSEIDPKWLVILYPQVFDSKNIKNQDSRKLIEKVEKQVKKMKF